MFNRTFVLLFLVVLAYSALFVKTDEILYPTKEGKDVGVTILAGAYINDTQYVEIGTFLQERSPYRLWVYLDEVINDFSDVLQRTRKGLLDAGMPEDAPFIAIGHSMGGGVAFGEVEQNAALADAVVVWGGSLLSSSNMASYPVPALTVSGDMEGMRTRVTAVAKQFRDLQNIGGDYIYKFPIITLTGSNHGQYATDPMPPQVIEWDLPADIDGTTARENIADVTVTFISYCIKLMDGQSVDEEELVFRAWFEKQSVLMKPIIQTLEMERTPDGKMSPWTMEAQYALAGMPSDLQITDRVFSKAGLVAATPEIERKEDGTLEVSTCTAVTYNLLTTPQTAEMIEAKMINKNAIDDLATRAHIMPSNTTSCKDVNKVAFDLAWDLASDLAKERFLRVNPNIRFMDDAVTSSGSEWIFAGLDYIYDGEELMVTSSVLLSSDFHFCKLLSPARALEFIYVDSLRPTGIPS